MSKELQIDLLPKQLQAFQLLNNKNGITEVLYGGSAGSAKTAFGSIWVIILCLQQPTIQVGVFRNQLARLKESTLVTIIEWLEKFKIPYKLNMQSNFIQFPNGSRILLKELSKKPSDANYTSLGGLELGAAFIDEVTEIDEKAVDVLKSRIRKHMPTGEPKLLMTCNPEKNWVKSKYYDPFIMNMEPPYQRFIQALPSDNPFLPQSYLDSLKRLNEKDKARLLFGDWEYADDETQLFNSDYIDNIDKFIDDNKNKYITADIATGSYQDYSVYYVWEGLSIIDAYWTNEDDTHVFTNKLYKVIQDYKVHSSKIVIDSDGIGHAVLAQLKSKGISPVKFNNNGTPIGKNNYQHLKAQCYYAMALNQIGCENKYIITQLKKELPSIREKMMVSGKISINSKDEQKKILGHSPDFADALMLRGYFLIKRPLNVV